MNPFRTPRRTFFVAFFLGVSPPCIAASQMSGPAPGTDSVVVIAHAGYDAGGFRRFLLGDNYRDLWTKPIKVPVLDLRTFEGGLRATKTGGGKQSRNVRLVARNGAEWVFRPVYKPLVDLPDNYLGTIVHEAVIDARSASHPLAPIVATPFMRAISVPHASPRVFVMPNDPALGEFREEFAGQLGFLEEFPSDDKGVPQFFGAEKLIDSDQLLIRINADPSDQVDSRAVLRSTLVDMILGDNDRHAGQWKWAQTRDNGEWVPIPRDRDQVFLNFQGFLLGIARLAVPRFVQFDTIPDGSALFSNSRDFHSRLFGSFGRPVWDSAVVRVSSLITDRVIDASMAAMPREYAPSIPRIREKLIARRRNLPVAAFAYYNLLASVVDLHGTDKADRALVLRRADGLVDIRIQEGNNAPWFRRTFLPNETREIRLYLHEGDDIAVVSGRAESSIPVRVIGGNGDNSLIDTSVVGGRSNIAHLYENSDVTDVVEVPDSVIERKAENDEGDLPFNRRPQLKRFGNLDNPGDDFGSSISPVVGLKSGHGLGLVPRIGIRQTSYGFRKYPYATELQADVAYSTKISGFEVRLRGDKRLESSNLHVPVRASMSELEVVEFRGFGNDVPDLEGDFYEVRQRAWRFSPALGLALNKRSDVSIGPIVRFTKTDSTSNRFITASSPYGVGSFGQAGIEMNLFFDTRNEADTARKRAGMDFSVQANPLLWGTFEMRGSAYPKVWDVDSAYAKISATAAAFITVPVLTRPVIALRAGGERVAGAFPYFDAAFLGGSNSFRTEHRQRFAGDASLFGTTELRVPIAQLPLILPFDVGAIGFMDWGRVYIDGESPGGWREARGAGGWIAIFNRSLNVSILRTNNPERELLVTMGFAF